MRKAPNRRSSASAACPDTQHEVGAGRYATSPGNIPRRGWQQVIRRTYLEIISDRISLVAAGCAFYATLALFPAINMMISLYGLIFDPASVESQLEVVRELMPPAAFAIIAERVHTLVSHGKATLGAS